MILLGGFAPPLHRFNHVFSHPLARSVAVAKIELGFRIALFRLGTESGQCLAICFVLLGPAHGKNRLAAQHSAAKNTAGVLGPSLSPTIPLVTRWLSQFRHWGRSDGGGLFMLALVLQNI